MKISKKESLLLGFLTVSLLVTIGVGIYLKNNREPLIVDEALGKRTLVRVPQGGTGWGKFDANVLLTGNGTGRLATTSVGSGLSLSNGVLSASGGTVTATSTFKRWDVDTLLVSEIFSTSTALTLISGTGTTSLPSNLLTGGNIVSDTDDTDDLGSLTSYYEDLFVAKSINMKSSTGATLTLSMTETNRPIFWSYDQASAKFRFGNNGNEYFQMEIGSSDIIFFGNSVNDFQWSNDMEPTIDSARKLGDTTRFWDETFTDELVLANDGTGATAADTVRLGGQDLAAGDAGLLITTENDTDHLFASRVGIASTSPWGGLSVEQLSGGILNHVFVVADTGTSTAHFLINQKGNTVVGKDLTVSGTGSSTFAGNLQLAGVLGLTGTGTSTFGAIPSTSTSTADVAFWGMTRFIGQMIKSVFATPDQATIVIDWNAGRIQHVRIAGNRTVVFKNPLIGSSVCVLFTQGSGNFTLAFPETVNWNSGGTAPALTDNDGELDTICFMVATSTETIWGYF